MQEQVALGICVVVTLAVILSFYFAQTKKIDKLEALLIKYGSKEKFENITPSGYRVDPMSDPIFLSDLQKQYYNEFLNLIPSQYKSKIKCDGVTNRMLNCIFTQVVRDKVVDTETSIMILLLLGWIWAPTSFSYNKQSRTVTMMNKQYSYDEFKNEFIQQVQKLQTNIDSYPNMDCPCNVMIFGPDGKLY
ncbi:MAG: hypothetical protein EBU90_01880 [Proteobacteria bacterium]|nr:hypothetical protein [Pseudomonadota bacterium]NBP13231.1 hypothetical protein [bacterium]